MSVAVTAKVDFVMKAGRIYRHGLFDTLQEYPGSVEDPRHVSLYNFPDC
jgi:hypothetical protein